MKITPLKSANAWPESKDWMLRIAEKAASNIYMPLKTLLLVVVPFPICNIT